MSYCKAKMHQIRLWLGLCLRPAVGAYSAPPCPLAGFKGPTYKGRRGGEGNGLRGGEGKGETEGKKSGKGGNGRVEGST